MPIIAFVGNKGGAGKTTLSVNLAAGLARQAATAVVDADPQGSAYQWSVFYESENTIPVYQATNDLEDMVRQLLEDYQYVVVDCPPSVHAPQTKTVLEFGDTAIIPVQPSPVDLWATVHIEEAVTTARQVNPALRALLVINQLEIRTTLSQLVREALSEISLPVAETALRRRAIYRNSALEGKTIFDMGRRGDDATEELNLLIQEII
jgi:chromosome partitioning protein